jgi:predicted PurR-regulated permease PerM
MNPNIHNSGDVTRPTLAVLFIGILIAASFWVVRPFLSSLVWAAMIVLATWPLLLSLQSRLWGKRGLAVAVMVVLLLLIFVVPLSLAIAAIIENADRIAALAKSIAAFTIPAPPEWLGRIPFMGPKLTESWQQLAAVGPAELSGRLAPYAGKAAKWFVSQAGGVGMMILQFLLTVAISGILFVRGESAASGVLSFAHRLAGQQGEEAAVLAVKAIRGVALAVVLTAIIQSVVSGTGLVLTGVPAAGLLTAVIFMLCVAQVGPGLVLIPAVIWLYWKNEVFWGTVLLVWSIFVMIIDNFIRPILIRKGADLPLLMIFAGVIGGLIAFGVIGLFIGPVVLAVTYTLLRAWVLGGQSKEETAPSQQKL